MHKIFVSVIIPAYNAEQTIARCLDSILNQKDACDYEVIVVNDGSTDSTGCIIEQYAKRDNKVKIINQKNQGVSKARWNGISAAIGDILAFVDSDDYVVSFMLEAMTACFNDPLVDVVACNFYMVRENQRIVPEIFYNDNAVFNNFQGISETIFKVSNGHLCNKVFKKSLLFEADYQQTLNLTCCEDLLLTFYLFLRAKKIFYLNECLYYYVQSDNSAWRKPSLLHAQDILWVLQKIETISRNYNYWDNKKEFWWFKLNALHFAQYKIRKLDTKLINQVRKQINEAVQETPIVYRCWGKTVRPYWKFWIIYLHDVIVRKYSSRGVIL